MKNFLPTLLCLATLLFVAWKDATFNVFPPTTWYDVLGIVGLAGLVASFVWGLIQQAEENSVQYASQRRTALYNPRVAGGYQPSQRQGKPTNPPKRE